MIPRGRRRRAAAGQVEDDDAAAKIDAATAMLHAYLRGGITVIPVADVLELLNAPPPEPSAAPPPRDPRADPVFGIMWAGPPGTLPPGGDG